MSGVQQVFPKDGGPAGGGGGGGGPVATGSTGGGFKLGKMRLGKREAAIGGAVAVAGLALLARARSGGDATDEDDLTGAGASREGGTAAQYEIDTRSTDFYNELQPELEAIGDSLSGLPQAVVDALPDAQDPYAPDPSPVPAAPAPKPKAKKPGSKSGAKTGTAKAKGASGPATKKPKPTAWVNSLTKSKAKAKAAPKTAAKAAPAPKAKAAPKPAPKPAPAPKPKKKK